MGTQKVRHQPVVVGEDAEPQHQEEAGAVHQKQRTPDERRR